MVSPSSIPGVPAVPRTVGRGAGKGTGGAFAAGGNGAERTLRRRGAVPRHEGVLQFEVKTSGNVSRTASAVLLFSPPSTSESHCRWAAPCGLKKERKGEGRQWRQPPFVETRSVSAEKTRLPAGALRFWGQRCLHWEGKSQPFPKRQEKIQIGLFSKDNTY